MARYFFSAKTVEDIKEALLFAEEKNVPIFILGGGSNVLVKEDFSGLILKIDLKGIDINKEDETAIAYAGEDWDHFVSLCVEEGLCGLEALSGIPGTVGAAPVQNIGAYGKEAKDVIKNVEVFDIREKQTKVFSNKECSFSYRNSIFKEGRSRYIIISTTFTLSATAEGIPPYQDVETFFKDLSMDMGKNIKNPTPQNIREGILKIRNNKLPDITKLGTSGSFFKNPIVSRKSAKLLKERYPNMPIYELPENMSKLSAAWLIEHIAEHKGVREGDVGVFEKHALVIVNYGKENGKEVIMFAEKIKQIIKNKTNIELEYEVVIL